MRKQISNQTTGIINSKSDFEQLVSYKIEQNLNQFEPIALGQLGDVNLQDRVDTKYLLSANHLARLLKQVKINYQVLEVERKRLQHYQTLYFDTNDFKLYLQHHNKKLNRYKVRIRKYLDSDISKLEVKFKNNKGRTIKHRKGISEIHPVLDKESIKFIAEVTSFDPLYLEPKIWNEFLRVTLVSKTQVERLTLDLNLQFYNYYRSVSLGGLVVAEVKQNHYSSESRFIQEMKAMNLRPMRFSKFCTGVNLMFADIKQNRFKGRLLKIEQLAQGGLT
ncbi:MAG: polyphosphate polymerase domain-containing protein [Anaerolineaceae bacterium]|nr:polyphosphate polymerase domain-containing protein [Anaerolineaceae bacterium]